MRLFTLLSGYVVMMLGTILAIHYNFTIGVLVSSSGLFMFWAMLPSTDQNERLRRYERQHQQWLKGDNNDRF